MWASSAGTTQGPRAGKWTHGTSEEPPSALTEGRVRRRRPFRGEREAWSQAGSARKVGGLFLRIYFDEQEFLISLVYQFFLFKKSALSTSHVNCII